MASNWKKTSQPGVRSREGAGGKLQYIAEWRDHGGKRLTKTFATQGAAVAAREAGRTEARRIRSGTQAPPPEAKDFGELADHWLRIKAAKKSIKDDRSMIKRWLRPQLGEMALPAIRKAHIDALYTELVGRFDVEGNQLSSGEVSKKTAWNILTLLGSMLREAKKQEWIASVPHVERPKLDEQDFAWIDLEQIDRLLDAAREDVAHPQLVMIIATGAFTGLRAGEVFGLRWSDIDWDARRLGIRRSFDTSTKSGAIRHIPLLGALLPILRDWASEPARGPWLFPTRTGEQRQADDRHTKQHFHAALERAGVTAETVKGGKSNEGRKRARRAFTFHDLRHSFASNWMRGGGDLFKLSKVLGHTSVLVTQRYAHLAPDAFDSVQVMGGVGGASSLGQNVPGLQEEVERLRAEVERLTVETGRQQKMLDRLLAG